MSEPNNSALPSERIQEIRPYLVWSNEHMAWWRSARCGYTAMLAEAGRYTAEEAADICGGRGRKNDPPDEVAVYDPRLKAPEAAEVERLRKQGPPRSAINALLDNNRLLWDVKFNVSDQLGHKQRLMERIEAQRQANTKLASEMETAASTPSQALDYSDAAIVEWANQQPKSSKREKS